MEREEKDREKKKERTRRINRAAEDAGDIVDAVGISSVPIDPFEIARTEGPDLVVAGGNFKDAFDGRLEYHRKQNRFLLFYNMKYDLLCDSGRHVARTRFSVGHELGHFYLQSHRAYLMKGLTPHGSRGEFASDFITEQEADAFAAGLLMPAKFLEPVVNQGELSLEGLAQIADQFETSMVSTAIRSVRHSDFPCSVAGIRDGEVCWQFVSQALIEGGCYPGPKRVLESPSAKKRWRAFESGNMDRFVTDNRAHHWFRMYGDAAESDLWVTEHYQPIRVMGTLIVLLTVSEEDLFDLDED